MVDKARVTEMIMARLNGLHGDSGIVVLGFGENAPPDAQVVLRIARLRLSHLQKSGPKSGATDRCEVELALVGMIAPAKSEAKGQYAAAGLAMKVAQKLRDWGDFDGTTDLHRLVFDTLESTTLHGEDEQGMVVVEEITAKGYAERDGGSGLASIAPLT
jgi:hypothetical protein